MNKRVKKLLGCLLAVLVLCQLGLTAAFAAEPNPYTYTVRVYAGSNGAAVNGKALETFHVSYGTDIDVSKMLSPGPGGVTDGKYYVKGIRQSGRDNNTVDNNVIHVTEDVDYVVAYGIKGELVKYVIHFVDQAGNEIAEPQEYYGNVGDKPVVSFLYIEGYEPLAYNLTKTLSANEADNNWSFPYRPVAAPAAEATPTPAPAGSATDTEGEAGEAAGEGAEGEEAGAGEEAAIDEEQPPLDEGPDELLDLDEEDTPLAQQPTERQQEQARNKNMMFASVGVLAAALAALIAFIILFVKKRKEKDAQ